MSVRLSAIHAGHRSLLRGRERILLNEERQDDTSIKFLVVGHRILGFLDEKFTGAFHWTRRLPSFPFFSKRNKHCALQVTTYNSTRDDMIPPPVILVSQIRS